LLPRRNVQDAIAKAPRKLGDGAQLIAPHKPIGHADAHHELARRRPAIEDAEPLNNSFSAGVRDSAPLWMNLRQVVEDAQAVTVHGGLITFNGVSGGADLAGFDARETLPSVLFCETLRDC